MAAADTRVDARDNERRDTDTEHHAGVHRQQDGEGTPLEEGIQAIYDTSRSLSAFVESYRKMTQLQTVNLEEIDLQRLVTNLQTLSPTSHGT